jgi:hypothetical protein
VIASATALGWRGSGSRRPVADWPRNGAGRAADQSRGTLYKKLKNKTNLARRGNAPPMGRGPSEVVLTCNIFFFSIIFYTSQILYMYKLCA